MTAQLGLIRNLTAGEIVGQALVALAEPALLVSVMVTVREWPTSPALTT